MTPLRRSLNFTAALGLLLLVVANVAKWMLERHSSMPESPRDALSGFLFGVAIACTLLGVWRMRRAPQRSC